MEIEDDKYNSIINELSDLKQERESILNDLTKITKERDEANNTIYSMINTTKEEYVSEFDKLFKKSGVKKW